MHEADHRESHAERETRCRGTEIRRRDRRPDEKQNAYDAEEDDAQGHPLGRDRLFAEGPSEAPIEHEPDERNGDERRQPRRELRIHRERLLERTECVGRGASDRAWMRIDRILANDALGLFRDSVMPLFLTRSAARSTER